MTDAHPSQSIPPLLIAYLRFTAKHDPDKACKAFVQRFGYPPKETFYFLDHLCLGPVKDTLDENHHSR